MYIMLKIPDRAHKYRQDTSRSSRRRKRVLPELPEDVPKFQEPYVRRQTNKGYCLKNLI